MNIFIVDRDPITAAQSLCDKHVVKMVTESAQMLSTAHRFLDGSESKVPSKSGKRIISHYTLPDSRESILYKAVHAQHPCTVWTMTSNNNYNWHYCHYTALAAEYQYRYGRRHGAFSEEMQGALKITPDNIPVDYFTPFAIAMKQYPDCIVENPPVASYRNYYKTAKADFAKWTRRSPPEWWQTK